MLCLNVLLEYHSRHLAKEMTVSGLKFVLFHKRNFIMLISVFDGDAKNVYKQGAFPGNSTGSLSLGCPSKREKRKFFCPG
jgi:hypothetical protein